MSKMELFTKIVNSWKLYYFHKKPHLNVWLSSEYASDIAQEFPLLKPLDVGTMLQENNFVKDHSFSLFF